jgi:hypothetical protein
MNQNVVGSTYGRFCIKFPQSTRPCLSTDQNEMSNPYSGPSIDASYQVLVQLAKRFQRRRLLEIDQSEISSSETVLPNEPKLGRSAMKISHFIPIR